MAQTRGNNPQLNDSHQVLDTEIESLRYARVNINTRRSYASTAHNLAVWLTAQGHGNCVAATRVDGKYKLKSRNLTTTLISRYIAKRKRDGVSLSSLQGIRSAVSFSYKEDNSQMPEEMAKFLTEVLQGAKRKLAQEKRASGRRITEGKDPLPFNVYKHVANAFYSKKDIKSQLYTVLVWNLMCRSNNVSHIRLERMHWCNDAVGISFAITKTDQAGERAMVPKHCYANPMMPEICVLLSLGIYFLCQPTSTGQLFPGDAANHTFEQAFMGVKRSERVRRILEEYGMEHKELGVHSFRKGSSTYVSGASAAGPPYVAVCVRCGWKMGAVQDKYLHYEQAGDQYVGRTVSGLPIHKAEFATLPPHFDREKMGEEKKEALVRKIKSKTQLVVRFPNMYPVVEHGIASVLFHYDWLKTNLPRAHPLFSTWIFTLPPEEITELRSFIRGGLESHEMQASGIPPHVMARRDSQRLASQNAELSQKLTTLIEMVGSIQSGGGPSRSSFDEELLKQAVATVLETTGLRAMADKFAEREIELTEARQQTTSTATAVTRLPGSTNHTSYQHSDGGFYSVPEGYDFPRVNVVLSWSLWWLGDPSKHIPPFRELASKGAIRKFPTKLGKYYSEWKSVFGKAEDYLEKLGKLPSNSATVTDAKISSMFALIKPLLESVYPTRTKKRMAEVKIATLGPKFRKVDINAFIQSQGEESDDDELLATQIHTTSVVQQEVAGSSSGE